MEMSELMSGCWESSRISEQIPECQNYFQNVKKKCFQKGSVEFRRDTGYSLAAKKFASPVLSRGLIADSMFHT